MMFLATRLGAATLPLGRDARAGKPGPNVECETARARRGLDPVVVRKCDGPDVPMAGYMIILFCFSASCNLLQVSLLATRSDQINANRGNMTSN